MSSIDGIIFDVDGTLWDSTEIAAAAWTHVIQTRTNYDMVITSERLKQLFGQTLPDIAKKIFPEETEAEQLALIDQCTEQEHVDLLAQCAPLYDQLEETLKVLSSRYPLYIVSNCEAGYIEVFLETTGLGAYFQGHLCPGDTGNAKAANIREIVETYHLKAPVYVGDTDGDHRACKEAGVPFVFASYGFGDTLEPDFVIQQLMDLTLLF